jgi:lysophospholipase L1-like esterase
MMGDSISTHGTVTNQNSYNPTLSINAVYDPHNIKGNSYHYSKVYWGKLATDTGMNLDVMNAWSGGRVYGKDTSTYNDNMLKRSYQLANTQGVNPDVVLLYYGINDINNSPSSIYSSGDKSSVNLPTGNLYQLLTNKGNKTASEVVATWFAEVQAKAENAGYVHTATNPVIMILSGIFGVAIAAVMLMFDFESVRSTVENRLPKSCEWAAAYSLIFTVLWLYIEVLNLLRILNDKR